MKPITRQLCSSMDTMDLKKLYIKLSKRLTKTVDEALHLNDLLLKTEGKYPNPNVIFYHSKELMRYMSFVRKELKYRVALTDLPHPNNHIEDGVLKEYRNE